MKHIVEERGGQYRLQGILRTLVLLMILIFSFSVLPAQIASADAEIASSDVKVRRYVNGAWGYSFEQEALNNDFKVMPTGNENWGWSFGRVTPGTYQVSLVAGSGTVMVDGEARSDAAGGLNAGTATMIYDGETVEIHIEMNKGHFLLDGKAWAGGTPLPLKATASKMWLDNSPGSFPGTAEITVCRKLGTIRLENVIPRADGSIYIAIHAQVLSYIAYPK